MTAALRLKLIKCEAVRPGKHLYPCVMVRRNPLLPVDDEVGHIDGAEHAGSLVKIHVHAPPVSSGK